MSDWKKSVSKKTNVLHILLTRAQWLRCSCALSPGVVGAVPALPSLLQGGVPALCPPRQCRGSRGLQAGTDLLVPVWKMWDQLPMQSHICMFVCIWHFPDHHCNRVSQHGRFGLFSSIFDASWRMQLYCRLLLYNLTHQRNVLIISKMLPLNHSPFCVFHSLWHEFPPLK